jgi:hypothetical protein
MAVTSAYVLCVFAFVMLLLAATLYAILLHQPLRARRWPVVQGTILSSKVASRWITDNSHDGSSGRYFQAHVVYEYSVTGQRYQGNRHGRSSTWLGSETSAKKIAARFAKGSAISVYCDPENPKRSMIWPHVGFVSWMAPLTALALSMVALWAAANT